MQGELSEQALGVIAKVQKLLALAGNNTNENEAALASAKAMQLLEAYNLDMATVERNTGKTGKRSKENFNSGLYKWQRWIWKDVAELHFCMVWSIKGLTKGSTYQIRLLGRQENVVTAKLMAEYLIQTVERLARERVGGDGSQFFTKSSISFREGMATRLSERLKTIRYDRRVEDERKKAEAARTHSTGTSLMLADVIQSERDANMDALHGKPEGWHAAERARMDAERIKREAELEAEYERQQRIREQWIADHPEEHAAQLAKAAKEQAAYDAKEARKAARRKPTVYRATKGYDGDYNAYGEGYRKGDQVGLDQQIDHKPTKRI